MARRSIFLEVRRNIPEKADVMRFSSSRTFEAGLSQVILADACNIVSIIVDEMRIFFIVTEQLRFRETLTLRHFIKDPKLNKIS